tara:strand:- start:303 stop:542 length:240 start_codon:yes stop_codon:yes gene_type:complete
MESNKIIYDIKMDEDNLNIEIRKFLKRVGITSQREIEKFIRESLANGNLKEGQSIEISMNLSSGNSELSHSIKEIINIK